MTHLPPLLGPLFGGGVAGGAERLEGAGPEGGDVPPVRGHVVAGIGGGDAADLTAKAAEGFGGELGSPEGSPA